jgi:hypothetical protein
MVAITVSVTPLGIVSPDVMAPSAIWPAGHSPAMAPAENVIAPPTTATAIAVFTELISMICFSLFVTDPGNRSGA